MNEAPYFARTSDGAQTLVLATEFQVYVNEPSTVVVATFVTREGAEQAVRRFARDGVRAFWRTHILDELLVPA